MVDPRLDALLRPLYQDLDGASRLEEVERIAAIARTLHPAGGARFEMLLAFHRLGRWLDKVGNLSRAVLAGLDETDLREVARSIRRLEHPETAEERVVAAAVLIDESGVRGLVERFAHARREGNSMMDVVRAAVSDVDVPEWLPPDARARLQQRREARREVCRMLLEELEV